MTVNERLGMQKQISYKDAINKIIDEIVSIENGTTEIDDAVKIKLLAIEEEIAEIEKKINQIDNGSLEALEAAKTKLKELESRVTTNESNISTNSTNISSLTTTVNTNADNISSLLEDVSTNTTNIESLSETVTEISESPYVWIQTVDTSINNTGLHNSTYVGKSLGSSFTSLQAESIAENAFEDMYIGDYWTLSTDINGTTKNINYRIGCFNYHQNAGDTALTTSSVLLVPDTILYSAPYNSTNTTAGGYVGSAMYTEEECVVGDTSYYGLKYAREGIAGVFGDNLISYRTYLQNAITNGYPSAGAWYDATVELMTEQMLYGSAIYGCTTAYNGSTVTVPNQYTIDKSQLPLFAMNPRMINIRTWYWLRNIVSAATFAVCNPHGSASSSSASNVLGVRPFFLVS